MRHRAHIVCSGMDTIKINTSFRAQKPFSVNAISNRFIDIINLKIVDKPTDFYCELLNEGEIWDLHYLGVMTEEEVNDLEKSPYVVGVYGVVNKSGQAELVGAVGMNETKSFEAYIP